MLIFYIIVLSTGYNSVSDINYVIQDIILYYNLL